MELAARCEAASGPSKTIDIAIADALGFKTLNSLGQAVYLHNSPRGAFSPPRFTASLDAALTLVPEGKRRVEFGTYENGRAWAYVHTDTDALGESDDAPTEAAAIVAAALRARSA
jgi:hypothetical protein